MDKENKREEKKSDHQECLLVIPNTFIMCGEGVGDECQFCSSACLEKSKEKKNEFA